MKKKWFLSLVAVAMVSFLWSCRVEAVNLEWDANTDDTVMYAIYYGNSSRVYTGSETTTLNTYTIDLPDGDWYFAVTALDAAGNESGHSNEVTTNIDTVPPMVPGTLRIAK